MSHAHREWFRETWSRREPTDLYCDMLRRDPCAYCGDNETRKYIDHIVPKARGGEHHWTNYASACQDCNSEKNCGSLLGYLGWLSENPVEWMDRGYGSFRPSRVIKGAWRKIGHTP